ncbi:MAG: bestrophin family ion channel, partial [Cyclobacteriaceae bacterium]
LNEINGRFGKPPLRPLYSLEKCDAQRPGNLKNDHYNPVFFKLYLQDLFSQLFKMFYYNPKDWLNAIFKITKSDTIRTLMPSMIFMALYSWGIVYLEVYFLKLSETSYAKDLTIMHSLLGFAISMLLVFRTNTAYDRWWKGRKLWGSLVNNSRNLAIKIRVLLPDEDHGTKTFFRQVIPLYASALQKHLQKKSTKFQLDEKPHPELPDFKDKTHVPNKVAESMIFKINAMYKLNIISGDQLIVLNGELSALNFK